MPKTLDQLARPRPQPVIPAGMSAALADRLIGEGLLSLIEIAKLLPRTRAGRPVATSSVFRWVTTGKRGVRLEAVRLNGTGYFSSRAALARFAAALTTKGGVR